MSVTPHSDLVASQFGSQASAYVGSAVHASGADLERVAEILSGHKQAKVLDLGCGGGHVSYTASPHVASVTSYDLSENMLEAVKLEAEKRGLANITTQQGMVEDLPFTDNEFDFVLCRYSAHHWQDLPKGLAEAYRVLKPGGKAVFMDVIAPEKPLLDTFLQTIEMLRDMSHVRDYSLSEWEKFAANAGFLKVEARTYRARMEFASWTARMKTSELNCQAIKALMAAMPQEVRGHFAIEGDSSFTMDTMLLELDKL